MTPLRTRLFVLATVVEARPLLQGISFLHFSPLKSAASGHYLYSLSEDRSAWIVVTGMGPVYARRGLEEAFRAVPSQISSVIGVGFAGGLVKSAKVGAIAIPTSIVYERSERNPTEWLRMRLAASLKDEPLRRSITVSELMASPAQKAALFAATGAETVDMESAAWGGVCGEMGIPWAIMRTVLDPADELLSKRLSKISNPFGQVDWKAAVRLFTRYPGELKGAISILKRAQGAASRPYVDHLSRFLQAEREIEREQPGQEAVRREVHQSA